MNSAFSKLALLGIAFSSSLYAQNNGLEPQWDIRNVLVGISAYAGRLLPMLNQIEPQTWLAKGAPDTYVAQWNSSKEQAKALESTALALSKDPEKLSAELEALFRINSLDNMLVSLEAGIRKYQNPAVAELLAGVAAENGANRERLQRYIVDLAADKEQQFQIMDHEAQRCRGILTRQDIAPAKKGRK